MVWSNWRGALVVLLAWVGLAWSQTPRIVNSPAPGERTVSGSTVSPSGVSPSGVSPRGASPSSVGASSVSTSSAGERIMTVHENGQALRCRVVSTWRQPNGTQAHQLQVLATGEMMTIVEDGAPAPVGDKMSKMKALPMRIFHWGRNRVPPPGAPVPPTFVAGQPTPAGIPMASGTSRTLDANCDCNQCAPGTATRFATKPVAPGKEQIVWWEEKDGRRVSPPMVSSKNPFPPTVVTLPSKSMPAPIVVEQGPAFPKTVPTVPLIVDAGPSKSQVVTASPAKVQPSKVTAPKVVTTPQTITTMPTRVEGPHMGTPQVGTPRMATSAPAVRTVAQPVRTTTTVVQPMPSNVITLPSPGEKIIVVPEKKPAPWQQLPVEPKVAAVTTQPTTTAELTLKAKPPVVQTGPTLLPNLPVKKAKPATTTTVVAQTAKTPDTAVAEKTPATPTTTPVTTTTVPTVPMPTPAASADKTKPQPMAAKSARPTMADKLRAWLQPQRESSVVRPADPKPVASGDKSKKDTKTDVAKAPERVPFSTAADPSATTKNLPPPLPTPGDSKPLAIDAQSTTPEKLTATAPSRKSDDARPVVQRKDWRSMWGQAKDAKTEAPGRSTVEQAKVQPDPTGVPALPPASMVASKPGDILLTPEKFDPNGNRLAPKGIQMNAYRGDPANSLAQLAPQTAQTRPSVPSMPAPNRLPDGAQSVLAASNNVPGRVTYIPVPVATVPEPYRPPMPPAPKLPEAPQLNAYVNAFSPPPLPQEKQPENPMMVNAFSNMNLQTNANAMAQHPQMPMFHPQQGAMPGSMPPGHMMPPMMPQGAMQAEVVSGYPSTTMPTESPMSSRSTPPSSSRRAVG